ncbi:hypothetical protein ACHHYP_12502 [Achlya hypogyna]|uniref:Uncharacterized protein n=1 Tax=Achlya hypogyna TaxID=1202772 RepID=A0A1V9YGT0_ACHHY|nr:hypothetical protein ACHHYP_12502 [Achlya hypogyna]
MKLGEYLIKKKWHILFLTQGLTLSSIYAHRFGFLDNVVRQIEAAIPSDDVAPLAPAAKPTVPVWKQIADKAPNNKESE